MDIKIGGKDYSFKALSAAAAANHFPDILFFAGGKCVTPGGKAKIKLTLSLGSNRLKKWSETIEYLEVDGAPVGNMFDGYLLKKDDIEEGLEIKCEINDGNGYQEATTSAGDVFQIGSLQGLGTEFVSTGGNLATFGIVVTA